MTTLCAISLWLLAVAPVTKAVTGLGSSFRYTFPPYSLTVLHLKTR